MKFCYECGNPLTLRQSEIDGLIPYCEHCNQFRFPIYSTAIITPVFTKELDKVVLIKQYGRPNNILLAGYINKGECAEDAVVREVQEEIRLNVIKSYYIKSSYFEKTNTLMLGYISIVEKYDLNNVSSEVDEAKWYTIEKAKDSILKNSLAENIFIEGLKKLAYCKL